MATAAVAAALSGQMGVGGSYVLPPSRLADSVIQWYRAQRDWSRCQSQWSPCRYGWRVCGWRCERQRTHRLTFQLCIWDQLKEIDDPSVSYTHLTLPTKA